jgi:hypothetical protein
MIPRLPCTELYILQVSTTAVFSIIYLSNQEVQPPIGNHFEGPHVGRSGTQTQPACPRRQREANYFLRSFRESLVLEDNINRFSSARAVAGYLGYALQAQ